MGSQSEKADRCKYFEGLFSPYIHGELKREDRSALAEHLHECETCSEQFGLAWKAAAQEATGAPLESRFGRRRPSRISLWLILMASLTGILVLGWSGILRSDRTRFPALKRRTIVDEELGRMIAVQTELLESMVDPLRGSQQTISHALRGEALDYFESLAKLRDSQEARASLEAHFHSLFRAVDPEVGGRSWDRREFLEELEKKGIPTAVPVTILSASPRVILCSVAWGERPAFAFLVREQLPGQEESRISASVPPFRLAYLLLSRP